MAKIYYNDNGTWKVVDVPGGGSGGTGDVSAVGDNTFTGKNTYQYLYNGIQYGEVRIFPSDYDHLSGKNAITIGNNYASIIDNVVSLGCDGLTLSNGYYTWLKPGSLQVRSIVADAGIELAVLSGPPTAVINTKHYRGDVTGVITIPYGQTGTMVVDSNVKTLFGNQSIVGAGNIDLYKHSLTITFTPDTGGYDPLTVYAKILSSNNLNIDSLTDLKTVLGNTFNEPLYGGKQIESSDYGVGLYMTETALYWQLNGLSIQSKTWANVTITDTVTTV